MNNNPAFGEDLQPFMGIPTFMRLPSSRDLENIDVVVMGVPFDSGTSYRSGTRFGPRKIREASLMLWGHNPTMHVTPLDVLSVVDYGDVSVTPTSIQTTMTAITETAGQVLNAGATLISLGGAYTITNHDVFNNGVPKVLEEVHQCCKGPVYVSIDIDSADPAYAPGTGTPEVGGLTSYQLLQLVRGLGGLNLVGFDLVEVSPPYDHSDITAILASNIVFEYLSLLAIK